MRKLLALGERLGGVVRRPRPYLAVVFPLSIPLILATVSVVDPSKTAAAKTTAAMISAPQLRYQDLFAGGTNTPAAALPEHSMLLAVEEDDTLDGVLRAGGLDRAESGLLTREFGRTVDLRRIRPGNLLRFHYDAIGKVDSVEMKMIGWGELDAIRKVNGFDVTPRPARIHEVGTAVAARIESSLYDALRSAGEGPQLVQQLVDVFQWDIDFFALKKADSFSLVVRKKYAGADEVGYGPILAARFTHGGQTFEAYRDESPDGTTGYYSANGTPLRKQFLRAPLAFTRITSKFSNHRFHPLLHIFRPHHGVDYGAPVGTPVMTTADGVVLEASRNRGEGNYVKIRHGSRIETSYLHLSRFAAGIRPGAKVRQGQVIGYVGMTGLATGPHLDYRVSDNRVWLNPLQLRSITPDPLRADALRQFRENVGQLAPQLASAMPQVAETNARRRALF
jgi:murein DD-endopeptidase MepM/ murein hydrolase activator NlpD